MPIRPKAKTSAPDPMAIAPREEQKGLNPMQLRFAQEYVIDLNATQAAIRAGYSKATAQEQGSRLLTHAMVRDEVHRLQKLTTERLGVTQERVIGELAKIGFSNMADYMKVDGEGYPHLDFSALTRDQAAALTEVAVDEYVEQGEETVDEDSGETITTGRRVKKVKFKLADKRAALVDLGRHLGMFKESAAEEALEATRFHTRLLEAFIRAASIKTADAIEI